MATSCTEVNCTILLVDRDDAFPRYLCRLIPEHTVLSARDARAALATLDKFFIDLVLVNDEMPDMDGLSLLGEVRRQYPEVTRVLVGEDPPPYVNELIFSGVVEHFVPRQMIGAMTPKLIKSAQQNRPARSDSGPDRRCLPRYDCSLPVLFRTELLEFEGDAEVLDGEAADISQGGLFVRSQYLEAPGTPVSLRLSVPRTAPLDLHGHVAWVAEEPPKGPGMGIQIEGTLLEQRVIDQLLEDSSPR